MKVIRVYEKGAPHWKKLKETTFGWAYIYIYIYAASSTPLHWVYACIYGGQRWCKLKRGRLVCKTNM